jgi:hypothetical protein
MMETTTVPGAEHYREIAGMLREAAGSFNLLGLARPISARISGLGCGEIVLNPRKS